jgi:hypothetical protein
MHTHTDSVGSTAPGSLVSVTKTDDKTAAFTLALLDLLDASAIAAITRVPSDMTATRPPSSPPSDSTYGPPGSPFTLASHGPALAHPTGLVTTEAPTIVTRRQWIPPDCVLDCDEQHPASYAQYPSEVDSRYPTEFIGLHIEDSRYPAESIGLQLSGNKTVLEMSNPVTGPLKHPIGTSTNELPKVGFRARVQGLARYEGGMKA